MAYDKVQFIAYCIHTGPKLTEWFWDLSKDDPDWTARKQEYQGLTPKDDIKARVDLVGLAIETAYKQINPNGQDAATVLKIFMMPEFSFRGKNGAYEMDDIVGVGNQLGLIDQLQNLVKDPKWQHWIFVFGTIIGVATPANVLPKLNSEGVIVGQEAVKDETAIKEAFNFVLVQEGGFGQKPAHNYARIIPKALKSHIDFIKTVQAESGIVSEAVAHSLTQNEQRLLKTLRKLTASENQSKIQKICHKNQFPLDKWTALKQELEKELNTKGNSTAIQPSIKAIREAKTDATPLSQMTNWGNKWQPVVKKIVQLYLPESHVELEAQIQSSLKKMLQESEQITIEALCKKQGIFDWPLIKAKIKTSLEGGNPEFAKKFVEEVIAEIKDGERDITLRKDAALFWGIKQLLAKYQPSLRTSINEIDEAQLFPREYDPSSFIFRMKNLTFGLEVCRDHGDGVLFKAFEALNQPSAIDIHLIPSCGMDIRQRWVVARKGGFVFNCDGYDNKGKAPTKYAFKDSVSVTVTGQDPDRIARLAQGNDPNATKIPVAYLGHSEVQKVVGTVLVGGRKEPQLTNINLRSPPPIPVTSSSGNVKDIYPAGAGELHIYQEQTLSDLSMTQSLFPHLEAGMAFSLADEPILINGMKVIFDETVPVYPVTLVHKDSLRQVKETKNGRR